MVLMPWKKSEAHRHCASDRAQWQDPLGPLALGLPEIPSPDLRRMGRQLHSLLILGACLLREPQSQGGVLTTPLFVPLHSSGFEFSFVAGSTVSPTTNLAISPRSRSAIPQSSNSSRKHLHNLLAVRLRARVRRQDNQSSQFLRGSRPDPATTPRFHGLSHAGHPDCPSRAHIAGLMGAARLKCAGRRHHLARR